MMSKNSTIKYLNKGTFPQDLRFKTTKESIWKYYENLGVIGKGGISKINLIRKKNSKKNWKKWRREFENSKPELTRNSKYFISHNQKEINERVLRIFRRKKIEVTGREYALKRIDIHRMNQSMLVVLRREIQVMKNLDHPHIAKAYECFEKKWTKEVFLVMEYLSGGTLWRKVPCSEDYAKKIMSQVLSAVNYMHEKNIVHRDLKLENIMFVNDSPNSDIKIIDFGLCTKYKSSQDGMLTTQVGTKYTMSPQVILRQYGKEADIWACGIVTYILLSNTAPFYSKDKKKISNLILKGNYTFKPQKVWNNISSEAKYFINGLLKYSPSERLTAIQALGHNWLQFDESSEDFKSVSNIYELTKKLRENQPPHGVKKLAIYTMASRTSNNEQENLRKLFYQCNKSRSGSISLEEFKSLYRCGLNSGCEDDIEKQFQRLCFSSDNRLYYTDFIAALIDDTSLYDEDKLAEAFIILDPEDNGYITVESLNHFLGKLYTHEETKEILAENYLLHGGRLYFDDFLKMFKCNDKSN